MQQSLNVEKVAECATEPRVTGQQPHFPVYSQMKAYYLQQMGIQTWVRRELPQPVPRFQMLKSPNGVTELVIVAENIALDIKHHWPSEKVGKLVRQMLSSIQVSAEKVAFFCSEALAEQDDISKRDSVLYEQITRLKPKVIWVWGQFSSTCLDMDITPVLKTIHPHQLLQMPQQKKKVMTDLMTLKGFLESS